MNAITANVPGLGVVSIEIDSSTGRPVRISGQNNGKPLTWTFSDWGSTFTVLQPGGAVQDRGPGGIPC